MLSPIVNTRKENIDVILSEYLENKDQEQDRKQHCDETCEEP